MNLTFPSDYRFVRDRQYYPSELTHLVGRKFDDTKNATQFSYRFLLELPDVNWYYGTFFTASGKGSFILRNILSWRPAITLEGHTHPARILNLSKLEVIVKAPDKIDVIPTF